MHMPSRVSASCTTLVPSRNQVNVIAHLIERTTIQVQHAILFSTGFTALRRGMQKMQGWCEHMRPRWSAKQRLHLIAAVPREGTVNISDLITPTYGKLVVLKRLAKGCLQREIQLCQK